MTSEIVQCEESDNYALEVELEIENFENTIENIFFRIFFITIRRVTLLASS